MNLRQNVVNNHILAVTIGVIYLWFGLLKFFPGLSPAEELAQSTILALTFNQIPSNVAIILLAIWEVALGFLFMMNLYRPLTIRLAYVHLAFTFTPYLLFYDLTFADPPFGFTLLGQYIAKNIVFVAALITLDNLTTTTSKDRG